MIEKIPRRRKRIDNVSRSTASQHVEQKKPQYKHDGIHRRRRRKWQEALKLEKEILCEN